MLQFQTSFDKMGKNNFVEDFKLKRNKGLEMFEQFRGENKLLENELFDLKKKEPHHKSKIELINLIIINNNENYSIFKNPSSFDSLEFPFIKNNYDLDNKINQLIEREREILNLNFPISVSISTISNLRFIREEIERLKSIKYSNLLKYKTYLLNKIEWKSNKENTNKNIENRLSYLPHKVKLFEDDLNYIPYYDNKNTIKSSGKGLYQDFYKRNKENIYVSPKRIFK